MLQNSYTFPWCIRYKSYTRYSVLFKILSPPVQRWGRWFWREIVEFQFRTKNNIKYVWEPETAIHLSQKQAFKYIKSSVSQKKTTTYLYLTSKPNNRLVIQKYSASFTMTGTHFQVLEAAFQKIHSAVEVLNQSAAKVRTIWVFGELPGWEISVGAVFCLSFALRCSAGWRWPQISLCTNIVKQTFHPLHVSVWIPSPWYQDGGRNRWISYNKTTKHLRVQIQLTFNLDSHCVARHIC